MAKITKEFFPEQIASEGWTIGDHSYGVPKVLAFKSGKALHVGRYCSIASDVTIFLGGNHRPDWVTTYPFNVLDPRARKFQGHPATRGDVTIGNDVWLGFNCTIMSGVTIGDGACIAARAHVVRDVPPYAIVGGNPADVIKKRFTDGEIASLLEIRWWDWSEDEIFEAYPYLLSPDIGEFIAYAKDIASKRAKAQI